MKALNSFGVFCALFFIAMKIVRFVFLKIDNKMLGTSVQSSIW